LFFPDRDFFVDFFDLIFFKKAIRTNLLKLQEDHHLEEDELMTKERVNREKERKINKVYKIRK